MAAGRATAQSDLLFKLNREIRLDPAIRDLFHTLSKEGNRATLEFQAQHKEVMDTLIDSPCAEYMGAN